MDCRVKPGNDGWRGVIQVNRNVLGAKPGRITQPLQTKPGTPL
jgi:hypothetical protein